MEKFGGGAGWERRLEGCLRSDLDLRRFSALDGLYLSDIEA